MKPEKQKEACRLRAKGLSIPIIARQLVVSKSSVSRWVESTQLTTQQKAVLEANSGVARSRYSNKIQQNRIERHKVYRQDGYILAEKDISFRILCALYWGEGSKARNVFSVANADVALLRIFVEWLKKEGFYDKMTFRAHYYRENGIEDDKIRQYWKQGLQLLSKHLRKPVVCTINRASQRKKIGKLPYGTGHLTVCSTELVQKVYGGIEFLKTGNW